MISKGRNIGPVAGVRLACALLGNTELTALDLQGNGIGERGRAGRGDR
jgi:hypothetical protein